MDNEAEKELPDAGGDPGASMMVKKKHLQHVATSTKSRLPATRPSLKRYQSRPLKSFKRTVSLDDLSRKVEEATRRRGRMGPVAGGCALALAAAAAGAAAGKRSRVPVRRRRPPPPRDASRGDDTDGTDGEDGAEGACCACRCSAVVVAAAAEDERQAKAGRRIFCTLMLHAWRKRRAAAVALQAALVEAGGRAEGLALQVAVLRPLLDAERGRVALLADDARASAQRADRALAYRHQLQQERDSLEEQLNQLKAETDEMKTQWMNAQNDCMTAHSQTKELEAHLAGEREKLAQIQAERLDLLRKVNEAEARVQAKEALVQELQEAIGDLKTKLSSQEELRGVANAAKTALLDLEREQEQLTGEIRQLQSREEQLQQRLEVLEERQGAHAQGKAALEAFLADQQAEVARLNLQLRSYTWRERVLQMARSLAQLPLALLPLLLPYSTQ